MIYETEVGPISLGIVSGELICTFGRFRADEEPTDKLASQLADYLAGKNIQPFSTPVPETTLFTRKCWEACRRIPYGTTISYKELAQMVKAPKAVRAVGQAMKRNPTLIITPCHRVVASSGALHGFAGVTRVKSKELKCKQFLLNLEQRTIRP